MGEKDERLEAIYNHANQAKHMHTGLATKHRYGWIGGGRLLPGGVFKADVRVRPDLYICANCRQPFTVTSSDVFCGNCSQGQKIGMKLGRPADAPPQPKIVEEPPELPPPPDLTVPPPRKPVSALEFGGTRHDYIVGILQDNGVMFVDQAYDLGLDGLVSINGIGQKTAKDILAAI